MTYRFHLIALFALGITLPLPHRAAIYYVNPAKGSDANDGTEAAPFRTAAAGIKAAKPGDTVVIQKVGYPIRESISIQSKSGIQDHPITIDGQGNLFTGSDPIKPEEWTEIKPGVYCNEHMMRNLKPGDKNNSFLVNRFFIVLDGVQNRMGHSSKGHHPPFVSPDQLKPGEWTYEDAKTAFYIAIDPAKKLADYHIEIPIRMMGVTITGSCSHLVVRNINTTHFLNNGFSVQDHTEDILLQNISTTECGADGLSQRENSVLAVLGFVSRHNSMGMTLAKNSIAVCDEVVLEDNFGGNLTIMGGTHTFSNSTISAKAPVDGDNGIYFENLPSPGNEQTMKVKFITCQIPFPSKPNPSVQPPFLVVGPGDVEFTANTIMNGEVVRKNSQSPPSGPGL